MKHLFIVNPVAGGKDRHEYVAEQARLALEGSADAYEVYITTAPMDACAKIKAEAASGEELRVYACGGDGTLNEVVNGVIGCPNAAVTHYPGGSGNDAIKIFDDPAAFTSIERLLSAEEAPFDLIRCNDSYALNVLSIGFDARVGTDIARFKRLPLVTGKGAYVLSILSNMVHGLSADYTVTLDSGEVLSGQKTMICICNGRWYGGGFNPVPEAEPDDGLLDVLVVEKVSLLQVASVIGHYQKGRYAEYPELIRHARCRSLRIECAERSVVNVDGEAVYTTDAKIEVVPHAIRFFYPKGLSYHAKIHSLVTNLPKLPLDFSRVRLLYRC